MRLILKKLSLSEQQIEEAKELLAKGVSGNVVASKLKVSQPTLWRNMEMLGINNKKKIAIKEKPTPQPKYFNWEDYEGDYYFFTR